MKCCAHAERGIQKRAGMTENACAQIAAKEPIALKKSAADVIDGYYKRRYIMFKEMYEHGNAAR